MAKEIPIVVSGLFPGFGDMMCALKLAEGQIKKYAQHGQEAPTFCIVTEPEGQEKIRKLLKDRECDVAVLTPQEFKVRVDANEFEIKALIEGPTISDELMASMDEIFASLPTVIPTLILTEYSLHKKERGEFEAHKNKINQFLNLHCKEIILSGFNKQQGEQGILISEELSLPEDRATLIAKLDKRLSEAMSHDNNTEFYVQYSNDTLSPYPTAARRFLEIHRRLVLNNSKNQDIVMIGPSAKEKLDALEILEEELSDDGFTDIIFCNLTNNTETCLYQDEEAEERKIYRVLYLESMSHESLKSAFALSFFIGATGDQSFSEALSFPNKWPPFYESLNHKQNFALSYAYALLWACEDPWQIIPLLRLYHGTGNEFKEYQTLAPLLQNPALQEQLIRANHKLLQENDLHEAIYQAIETIMNVTPETHRVMEQKKHMKELKQQQAEEKRSLNLAHKQSLLGLQKTLDGQSPTRILKRLAREKKEEEQMVRQLNQQLQERQKQTNAFARNFKREESRLQELLAQEQAVQKQHALSIQEGAFFSISPEKAEAILTKKEGFPNDYNILPTSTGFYYLNPLKEGNNGIVFKAQHYSLNKLGQLEISNPVAIKRTQQYPEENDKELNFYKRLYPQFKSVFKQLDWGFQNYLVMPYFPGLELDQCLKLPLNKNQQQTLAVNLLNAIAVMHENKIVHLDLKQHNILINPHELTPYIIDFELSAVSDSVSFIYDTLKDAPFGFEIPPEYLTGTRANPSLDIFSLTPSLAAIFGVDRKALVKVRLDKVLPNIGNRILRNNIELAFQEACKSDPFSFGEALFLPCLQNQIDSPAFESFIKDYIRQPYDFLPYSHLLNSTQMNLLNAMQARDPAQRPNIEQCIELLKISFLDTPKPKNLQTQARWLKENYQEWPSFWRERNSEEVSDLSAQATPMVCEDFFL